MTATNRRRPRASDLGSAFLSPDAKRGALVPQSTGRNATAAKHFATGDHRSAKGKGRGDYESQQSSFMDNAMKTTMEKTSGFVNSPK